MQEIFIKKTKKITLLKRVVLVSGFMAAIGGLWYLQSVIPPQITFFAWTAPFHGLVRSQLHNGGKFIYGFTQKMAILEELEAYQKESQRLYSRLARMEHLKEENEFLRASLSLKQDNSLEVIPADIIGFQSDGFEEIIVISWEDGQSVQDNMAVVSDTGILVGKTFSVQNSIGYVMLLSDPRMVFNGKVLRTGGVGIATGMGLGRIKFDLVEKKNAPQENDLLVTSAIGGIFPPDLVFGKIEKTENSDFSVFTSSMARYLGNPRTTTKVLIIRDNPSRP